MTSSPPGPPCDLCEGAEAALMSLMNLADYSQVKIGVTCAGPFFEGLAAQFQPPAGAGVPDGGAGQPHTEHDVGPREDGGVPAPGPAASQPRDEHGRYQPRN